MSDHNIVFYEDLTKIIYQLSSNTHLISSSACGNVGTVIYLIYTFPIKAVNQYSVYTLLNVHPFTSN